MSSRLVRFAPLVCSVLLGLGVLYAQSMTGLSSWATGMLALISLCAGILILFSLLHMLIHKVLYLRTPELVKLIVEALSVFVCVSAIALGAVLVWALYLVA